MEWLESRQLKIAPPKRTKKITGTRFATILGLNPWSTPFEMWLAITKTYEIPFEDTIYTKAGKAIEPKQAEYMKKSYGMDIITPTDRYGEDYFKSTWGDFFPESKHLGGMWDYLGVDENGVVDTVLEMKTTKRIEDWQNDAPEYYALQAALYAYLLGVDNVIMVASFLEEKDYADPTKYTPNIKNTITVEFKVSERYPDFAEKIKFVENWWAEYVDSGISPVYDEKKDAELLAALRTHTPTPTYPLLCPTRRASTPKSTNPTPLLQTRKSGSEKSTISSRNTLWGSSVTVIKRLKSRVLSTLGLCPARRPRPSTRKLSKLTVCSTNIRRNLNSTA